ncbi:MAG: hypothetical protein ABI740_07850 [Alphaproteobacteria bacterium]
MRTRSLIAGAVLALLTVSASPALAQDAESQVFLAAKSCVGLTAYLRAYPSGRFRAAADKRIAAECAAAPAARPVAPPVAPPAKPATPPGPSDPCRQARADWAQISATTDAGLLHTFLAGAPAVCTVQRAQAQTSLNGLQSAASDEKRKLWNGVPDFDGVWVLEPGTNTNNGKGCGNLPWRYAPNGALIRRLYPNNTFRDMKVLNTNPPALGVVQSNKGGAVIEGQRMRIIDADGKTACYLKRQ